MQVDETKLDAALYQVLNEAFNMGYQHPGDRPETAAEEYPHWSASIVYEAKQLLSQSV